jgi:hypothetical protein
MYDIHLTGHSSAGPLLWFSSKWLYHASAYGDPRENMTGGNLPCGKPPSVLPHHKLLITSTGSYLNLQDIPL